VSLLLDQGGKLAANKEIELLFVLTLFNVNVLALLNNYNVATDDDKMNGI